MSTRTVSVRLAEERDREAIRQLLANTPMSASLPLVIERPGATITEHELVELVAYDGAQLLGFIGAAIEERRVWRAGQLVTERVGYIGDLRVRRAAQRRGVALELLTALCAEGVRRKVFTAFCLVNEGNVGVLELTVGGRGGVKGKVLRTFHTASRLVLRRPPVSAPVLEVCTPTDEALQRLCDSLQRRFLAPAFSVKTLRAIVDNHPELQFFAAPGTERIAFALWDQQRIRRLVLQSMPWRLSLLRMLWNAAAPLSGAHAFPAAGHAWRSLETCFVADERLPDDLEPTLVAHAHAAGCHTVNFIESGLGLPSHRLRGPCVRLKTHLIGLAMGDHEPPECPPEVVAHVDLAFI